MNRAIRDIIVGVIAAVIAALIVLYLQQHVISSSVSYPNVAGQFEGTIHNTYLNKTTAMSLFIQQEQQNITGYLKLSPGLIGSGPFKGTVDSSGTIHFTVQSNEYSEPFSYSGTIKQDSSMSGTYCNITQQNQSDPTGEGTWSVKSG